MFPKAFIHRLKQQQNIDAEGLLHALEAPPTVTIRVNREKWKHRPLNSEPVPWCSDGYYIDTRPSYTLDPLFHSGCYYPQEASGMFLEQAFLKTADNKGYLRVLDLCGAPGGKSTHLSSLIGQRGVLVANEVIRSRAQILAENLTKWGTSNSVVTQNDPSAFIRLPGFFDLILVDAPCSGEGMFRDQVAIDEWSEENTAHCSERQKRILMDVWPSLKENGILIYSTCTFNPGENEKNIKWFTGKHKAEAVSLDVSDYKGITEIDFEGIHGYGFYPGKIRGEGLFYSVLRKTSKEPGSGINDKTGNDRKLSKEERTVVNHWTGFSNESLIKTGDDIISASGTYNDYNLIERNLKVIKAGTKILTVKAGNFIPSHELAMSAFFRNESFPVVSISPEMALHYLHRENITLKEAVKGWNVVSYNGVTLGFVKNLGNRVNNYYPVGWRIRMRLPGNVLENIRWEL